MAAKKRTTKKASNSIVEPKPTTSSNGRRIAILVIVVLGIVILWRNDPPTDEINGVSTIEEKNGEYSGAQDRDLSDLETWVPASQKDDEYAPQSVNGYEELDPNKRK